MSRISPELPSQGRTFFPLCLSAPPCQSLLLFGHVHTPEAGTVYFCEVQFQKDERLYERVFEKSLLYFYRNRDRFNDWQAVIIYPSQYIEQRKLHPHRRLLNSEQVHRVYMDELGEIRQLPLWVAFMVLTTVEEDKMLEEAS
jgi:predicted transposase YdaD